MIWYQTRHLFGIRHAWSVYDGYVSATRLPRPSLVRGAQSAERGACPARESPFANPVLGLKLTIIVDTWVSDHYGDPHAEAHTHHPAA